MRSSRRLTPSAAAVDDPEGVAVADHEGRPGAGLPGQGRAPHHLPAAEADGVGHELLVRMAAARAAASGGCTSRWYTHVTSNPTTASAPRTAQGAVAGRS